MKLTTWHDPGKHLTTWKIEIPDAAMADYHPLLFDQVLLEQCERTGLIADKIFGLAEIVRNIERAVESRKGAEG